MRALAPLALGILLALACGPTLPACPTEDSSWCYWDASTMGNGKGRSFVAVGEVVLQLPTLSR